MPERVVLVGYGPVGARFVEQLLPSVRQGLLELTVVGAEEHAAYNRVLIADYAVGRTERESLEVTDADAARAAGVRLLLGTTVTSINRTRNTVSLGSGEVLPYDRLVLATGARANVPTLDGVTRLRRDRLKPDPDGGLLDSAQAPLPRGVTALRDLSDADRVLDVIRLGGRVLVLGAGVLGMELALAIAHAGAESCVVHHGPVPMPRNLDRGAGAALIGSARRAGVTMVGQSRAEGVDLRLDDDGIERFDALICADGKRIQADLLVLSCGVTGRTELAALCGLPVTNGVLVDSTLRSHLDDDIYAIGDCAHVAARPAPDEPDAVPPGGPSGLIGPGWRQAEWLAARFVAELSGSRAESDDYVERVASVVMLKAEGVDVVAAGDVSADPWEIDTRSHAEGCEAGLNVAQWADPEHGRYVKMVTRAGVLEGFASVGMPRTGAELTLLFERGSELPADRSMLLRFDGPDYDPQAAGDAFAPDATVCWCNGVTVGAIMEAAEAGNDTVACIGSATRAGTGCGGCKSRIGEVLARFSASGSSAAV